MNRSVSGAISRNVADSVHDEIAKAVDGNLLHYAVGNILAAANVEGMSTKSGDMTVSEAILEELWREVWG